jgi:hypothetical protein
MSLVVNLGTVPSCITENPQVSPTILREFKLNKIYFGLEYMSILPLQCLGPQKAKKIDNPTQKKNGNNIA